MSKKSINFFTIKVKGKDRKIATYSDNKSGLELREKHDKIKKYLTEEVKFSNDVMAYVKNRSIITNAKRHMNSDIFIKMDIQKFFNSINKEVLLQILKKELDENGKNRPKMSSYQIINETFGNSNENGLYLGMTNSPVLSNIVLKEFDQKMAYFKKTLEKEKEIYLQYTRYADDITFSYRSKKDKTISANDLKIINEKIINKVKKELFQVKLYLNKTKTKIINFNEVNHVRITGVNIIKNSQGKRELSVGRKTRNKLFDAVFNGEDIQKIKGIHSFVTSIEPDFEKHYSLKMKNKIKESGYNSLTDLIYKK